MTSKKILKAIEQQLFARQLSSCERYVLTKSWEGEHYETIARKSGYDKDYIKQVGAKLWSELSLAIGESVTKKSLRLVLKLSEFETQKLKQTTQVKYRSEINPTCNDKACFKALPITDDSAYELLEKPQKTAPRPSAVSTPAISSPVSFPSHPIAANSSCYIERSLEELVFSEIDRPGCLLKIEGARKIGKSSLLNQILARVSAKQYATVTVDFQEAESSVFTDLDRLLRWFCASIARQTKLAPQLDKYWQSEMGSKVGCKIYLEDYIFKQIDRPIVIALNELNRLFEYLDLTRDFLSMLHLWHEQSKSNPLWQHLRLILIYSQNVCIPSDINQILFNIGISIRLPLFSFSQTTELARHYGLDSELNEEMLENLYQLLNGHPYLTSLAFYHLQKKTITYQKLIATAATPEGIFSNHLLGLLVTLKSDPSLTIAFQNTIATEESIFIDAIAAHKLEAMGLIQFEGGSIKPICQLYRLYFLQQLTTKGGSQVSFIQDKERMMRSVFR